MAGIDLSTAGVKIGYAPEATAGTRPTTGYKKIPGIKSVPELNPEPDNLESTTLEETEWKTYVPGLKDPGGALGFGANLTEKLMEIWDEVIDAYDTAAAANKGLWFCIIIPGLTKALFFKGQPTPMGMPGMEVSAILETTLYITPTGAPAWEVKPASLEEGDASGAAVEAASYSARQTAKKTSEVDV